MTDQRCLTSAIAHRSELIAGSSSSSLHFTILHNCINIKPIDSILNKGYTVLTVGCVEDFPKNMIYYQKLNENTNDGHGTDVEIDSIKVVKGD
jgi:hypothetical protein